MDECKRYHSRLAEIISFKKGEDKRITVTWIRSKRSFALPRPYAYEFRAQKDKSLRTFKSMTLLSIKNWRDKGIKW